MKTKPLSLLHYYNIDPTGECDDLSILDDVAVGAIFPDDSNIH